MSQKRPFNDPERLPVLSKKQAELLEVKVSDILNDSQGGHYMAAEKDNLSVKWFRTMDHLTTSKDISFSICNEFFDALPIHQFEFDENSKKWLEVLVDLEPTRKGSETVVIFIC